MQTRSRKKKVSPDFVVMEDSDVEEPESPSEYEDGSENSSVSEDVKVCDICGDAGQEELLAICSKCLDGAEHTYCMKVMLSKVPEGDWLCEECKLKDDAGNLKEEQSETVPGTSVVPGSSVVPGTSVIPGARQTNQGQRSARISTKCEEENVEVNPMINEKASDKNGNSKGTDSPMRESALPCVNLLSNEDIGRVKPSKPAEPYGSHSLNGCEPLAMLRPNPSGIQEQFRSPHGPSSQSNSLSNPKSRPEDRQLVGSVPDLQKASREFAPDDPRKEGLVGKNVKSASFKSVGSGCFNVESTSKIQSLDPPQTEDLKGVKQIKERNKIEKRSSSFIDHPLVSPSPVAGIGSAFPKLDLKFDTHSDDKNTKGGPPFLRTSKQAVAADNQAIHCQKCNEAGHSAEVCSVDKLSIFARKPSAERNLEGLNKSSKWKEAVGATISKGRIQQNTKMQQHTDLSAVELSRDIPSRPSSCNRNVPYVEVKADSKVTVINVNSQAACQVNKASHASRTNRASALVNRDSVIPELEVIWQGGFVVVGSGRLPKLCDGVQAHLSNYASPKVLEAVTKFPCKVRLEEVPSVSSWPLQNNPEEHNIGLFFFAKDVQSYERNLCKLLDHMLKNDLALKAEFNGVELLIFPSNKLPENSQRWNGLHFLWGIFRGRNCIESHPNFQGKPCGYVLNLESSVPELPNSISEVSKAQRINSPQQQQEAPASDSSPEAKAVESATFQDFQPVSSSGTESRIFHTQESPLVQESSCPAVVDDKLPSEQISCLSTMYCSSENMNELSNLRISSSDSNIQMNATRLCTKVKSNASYQENFGDKSEVRRGAELLSGVDANSIQISHSGHTIFPLYPVSSNCRQAAERSKREERDSPLEGGTVLDTNPGDPAVEKPNRKRQFPTTTETLSCGSSDTTKSSSEMLHFKEIIAQSVADGKEQKKMKLDTEEHVGLSSTKENLTHGSSSEVHSSSTSFLNVGKENGTSIYASLKTGEKYLAMDLCPSMDRKPNEVMNIPSAVDEGASDSCVPIHDLALGSQRRPMAREISASNVESNQENEENAAASLALSLAFPAPEKVQESIRRNNDFLGT